MINIVLQILTSYYFGFSLILSINAILFETILIFLGII